MQPVKVPGPPEVDVPLLIESVTVDVLLEVTVFPNWSSSVTCGCGESGFVALVVPGDWVKTNFVPRPA